METKTVKAIPFFPSYFLAGDGTVRSFKKPGIALTEKKGTGKMYLLNTNGKRQLIGMDELKHLVKGAAQTEKVKKEKAPRKPKETELTKGQTILTYKENKKVQEILKADESKDRKIQRLHLLGLPNYQIAYLTTSSKGNVSRGIWMYKVGHRTLYNKSHNRI